MSNIFKEATQTIVVNDCRKLNYLECMGLLCDSIIFEKFQIFNLWDYSVFLEHFDEIEKYSMRCYPENKSIEITLINQFNMCYKIYYIPFNGLLQILVKDRSGRALFESFYTASELEDLML